MRLLTDLAKKKISVENIVNRVLKDDKEFSELFEGILPKKDTIRFNSFKVLISIAEKFAKVLYPKWDFFVNFLGSDNTCHKYIAIYILANLTIADKDNRFEKIFDKYYALLNEEGVILAAQVAGNSWKIVKAKPKLQTKITNKLLSVDKTKHASDRKNSIKSYAIESFDKYFEGIKDKKKVIEFVKMQIYGKIPRVKKRAKEFLKKWAVP